MNQGFGGLLAIGAPYGVGEAGDFQVQRGAELGVGDAAAKGAECVVVFGREGPGGFILHGDGVIILHKALHHRDGVAQSVVGVDGGALALLTQEVVHEKDGGLGAPGVGVHGGEAGDGGADAAGAGIEGYESELVVSGEAFREDELVVEGHGERGGEEGGERVGGAGLVICRGSLCHEAQKLLLGEGELVLIGGG